jgi:hypothetical protein
MILSFALKDSKHLGDRMSVRALLEKKELISDVYEPLRLKTGETQVIGRFRSRTRTSKTTWKWRIMPMYGYAKAF